VDTISRPCRPPIPLPAVPGVTFLATVGAIVEEGERMGHCIATRAEDALRGRCFLFHIDHQGQRASVEVSAKGEIAQAQGPHNTDNTAAWWGARQLRGWGAQFSGRNIQRPRRPGEETSPCCPCRPEPAQPSILNSSRTGRRSDRPNRRPVPATGTV